MLALTWTYSYLNENWLPVYNGRESEIFFKYFFHGFSLLESPCEVGFLKPNNKRDTLYLYL